MSTRPRRGFSPAGKWLVAGTVLFIVSRLAIEIVRLDDAASEDTDFALQLAWTTSLTFVGTLALCFGLIYLSQRSAAVRHRYLVETEKVGWVFETIRAPDVRQTLRTVGAPPLIVGKVENSYFSLVADGLGLSFWVGSTTPTCEWRIEWSSVVSINTSSVPWLWLTLPAAELAVSSEGGTQRLVLPLSEIGRLQPRALSVDDFNEAISELRAILRSSSPAAT